MEGWHVFESHPGVLRSAPGGVQVLSMVKPRSWSLKIYASQVPNLLYHLSGPVFWILIFYKFSWINLDFEGQLKNLFLLCNSNHYKNQAAEIVLGLLKNLPCIPTNPVQTATYGPLSTSSGHTDGPWLPVVAQTPSLPQKEINFVPINRRCELSKFIFNVKLLIVKIKV